MFSSCGTTLTQSLLFLLIHSSAKDAKLFDLFFQSLQFFEAALPDTAFQRLGRVGSGAAGNPWSPSYPEKPCCFPRYGDAPGPPSETVTRTGVFQVFQLLQHRWLSTSSLHFQHLNMLISRKASPDVKGAFLFLIILARLLEDDLQLGLALA